MTLMYKTFSITNLWAKDICLMNKSPLYCNFIDVHAKSLHVISPLGKSTLGDYCLPPRPPYMEANPGCYREDLSALEGLMEGEEGMGGGRQRYPVWDMCFHLLKLYCDKTHRLHHVLAPTAHSPYQLDYRLRWVHCFCLQPILLSTGSRVFTPCVSSLTLFLLGILRASFYWGGGGGQFDPPPFRSRPQRGRSPRNFAWMSRHM